MVGNRKEHRQVITLKDRLGIPYAKALRLIREGRYTVDEKTGDIAEVGDSPSQNSKD